MICINIWHERYYEQLMIQSNFGDSVIILTTPPTATADSNNLNGKPIVSFSMSRISITIDILSQKSLKAVCLIQYNHNRCQLSRSLVKICCRCTYLRVIEFSNYLYADPAVPEKLCGKILSVLFQFPRIIQVDKKSNIFSPKSKPNDSPLYFF